MHFDIGASNNDPATWYDWGNWGGATEVVGLSIPTTVGNEFRSPERDGLFFHGVIFTEFVGFMHVPPYFLAYPDALTITHEIGHSLGLRHGGRPWAGHSSSRLRTS